MGTTRTVPRQRDVLKKLVFVASRRSRRSCRWLAFATFTYSEVSVPPPPPLLKPCETVMYVASSGGATEPEPVVDLATVMYSPSALAAAASAASAAAGDGALIFAQIMWAIICPLAFRSKLTHATISFVVEVAFNMFTGTAST